MNLISSQKPALWTVNESKVNTAVPQIHLVSESPINNLKWPPPRKLTHVTRSPPHLPRGNRTCTPIFLSESVVEELGMEATMSQYAVATAREGVRSTGEKRVYLLG